MGASASFESTSVPVEPGGQAETRLRVRNTGAVVDSFTFEPVGIPAGWVTVSPPELRLFPETEEYVTVTVTPPRSSDTPLGDMTFALRVISAEDPDGSIAEELTLQVSEFGQRGGELHPKTSTGRTKGVHELAVDNHGNTAITTSLVGVDVNDLVTFEIKPPSVTVEPGSAVIATVTVKPRKRSWRGQPKSHPFQVSVDDGDGEPVLLDGMFVQQPMVPKWLWKVLLALLLLLLLLWLLWSTLLKPTVESAARDSVEEFVEEEIEAIDERLDAAGIPEIGEEPPVDAGGGDDGGGGGGGGATTTTSTTVTPTTVDPGATGDSTTTIPTTTTAPPIEGVGLVDFRLALKDEPLGDATSANQSVAADTRLEVTDIIFQNPTGAIGEIRVQRGEEILFKVQMANFRDLDYHFVAPYVFDAGEVVQVVLICIEPGKIQPLESETACSAGVSFSGFSVPVPVSP